MSTKTNSRPEPFRVFPNQEAMTTAHLLDIAHNTDGSTSDVMRAATFTLMLACYFSNEGDIEKAISDLQMSCRYAVRTMDAPGFGRRLH